MGLTLCTLTAVLWALAVSAGLIAWAAPQAGPPGQTVPRATPTRPPTPTMSEEQPPLPTETLAPPGPTSSAEPASPTAMAGSQAPATETAPSALTPTRLTPSVTRQPAPTAAWQTTEAGGAATSARPTPQLCAPVVAPAAEIALPPVYDQSGPFSLAWLALLGVGTMLVGLGLFLIFRQSS